MLEVKTFPKDMSELEVDHTEPRRCLVSGLFEEPVEVNSQTRTFYTYIHPDLVYNQPCLVVAPPDGMPVLDYLEQGPWLAFAKEHNIFLHVLIPGPGGWDLDGADADYMNRVYVQINGRRGYVAMQDNIYAVGVGGGSTVAQQAVMKMSSEWSGLATFGDLDARDGRRRAAALVHDREHRFLDLRGRGGADRLARDCRPGRTGPHRPDLYRHRRRMARPVL